MPKPKIMLEQTLWVCCWGAVAFAVNAAVPDLTHLSIEELMQVKIVSATKSEQRLQDTAAAVFVITAEDIRRSGATSVMEALRLAPGVQASRIDSSRWAVTIRGFNGRFANKLLVMIDGRSIYVPQFSGVYWEVQDMFLPDIERIEVIRGPGGSLWGANAVNGVINIITKNARNTQGGLATLTAGNEERTLAGVRYGGTLGDNAHYRVYGQSSRRDGQVTPDGRDAGDDWSIGKGGFRVDWKPSAKDSVTAQGDGYNGDFKQDYVVPTLEQPYAERQLFPVAYSGGGVQARWEHRHSPTEQTALQAYYRRERYDDAQQQAELDTFDMDFQHSFKPDVRHEIVWGADYRRHRDRFGGATRLVSFSPDARTTQLFSLFAQDQIALTEQLRLTLGVKAEHNDYTGWEWQPNLRLIWQPADNQRIWGSVSRAVRTPSRAEEEGRTDFVAVPPLPEMGGLPAIVALIGDGRFDSEKLTAYEIGYRHWLHKDFSFDVTVFYNDYDKLLSVEQGVPSVEGMPPHGLFPLHLRNSATDDNYGAEIAADWRPMKNWRLQLAYSYLWSKPEQWLNWSPLNQLSLFSSWEIQKDLELYAWIYYVDQVGKVYTISQVGTIPVDAYLNLTLRLGWRPRKDWELSLVGANLLNSSHLEYVQEAYTFPVEIERSIYGQVKWSF